MNQLHGVTDRVDRILEQRERALYLLQQTYAKLRYEECGREDCSMHRLLTGITELLDEMGLHLSTPAPGGETHGHD